MPRPPRSRVEEIRAARCLARRSRVVFGCDTGNKADIASARRGSGSMSTRRMYLVGPRPELNTRSRDPAGYCCAGQEQIAIAVSPAGTTITNEARTATSIHWMYDTYALAAGTSKVLIDKGSQATGSSSPRIILFGHALEKDASKFINSHGGKVGSTTRTAPIRSTPPICRAPR